MLELIVFFVPLFCIATCFYSPEGYGIWLAKLSRKAALRENNAASITSGTLRVPEDSILRRHFLSQLQGEIEAALFPRPTDSVLQRHYDSLVAVELQNRLGHYR